MPLPDVGDGLRHAGENDLTIAQSEGEAAQENAGSKSRDEGADLEPDGQRAVDEPADDPGQDHRRYDLDGAIAGRPEHGYLRSHPETNYLLTPYDRERPDHRAG